MKPYPESGWLRESVPGGSLSQHTSGIAWKTASGMPSLSAPIDPYLKCSIGGLRIGVDDVIASSFESGSASLSSLCAAQPAMANSVAAAAARYLAPIPMPSEEH